MITYNNLPREDEILSKLDPNSSIALYQQIQNRILNYISEKDLQPDDILPSERELSIAFGVNRITVRKALEELDREGVISRHAGKGTFVAESKIKQKLLVVTSFTEAIQKTGHIPGKKFLEINIGSGNTKTCKELEIKRDTKVIKIVRLRFVDFEPFCLGTSYLNYELVPGIETLLENNSFYGLLEEKYHYKLNKTIASLEATTADQQLASLLNIKNGYPLFLMKGTVRDPSNRVIEYFEAFYRGDRLKFITESE